MPTPRAADAAAAVDAMLREVPGDGGTDFDALTARRLRERRELLAEFAGHQPPEIEVTTVGHLHGAFDSAHLRYGGSGNVTAVLGWDALTTGPVAGEVVRAAARLFAWEDDRGLDLDRVQAFVRGHRAAFPSTPGRSSRRCTANGGSGSATSRRCATGTWARTGRATAGPQPWCPGGRPTWTAPWTRSPRPTRPRTPTPPATAPLSADRAPPGV